MFTRSITRLTLALIIVVSALLLVTSFTANAAAATATTRPRADLIVNPGESIQAAIDAANDGDTILINAGDYTESLTLSKPVSLTGVNSDTTILHAVVGQRVLTVTGATISNSVVISGLTFTDGNATDGGGAYLDAPLMVLNARFISNTALQSGGGLYASEAATLTNVEFISNTAQQTGGGAYISGTATLIDTDFISNTSFEGGGGLEATTADITRGAFERNTTHGYDLQPNESIGTGGGVEAITLTLTDTRFISNTAYHAGGGAGAFTVQINGGRFEHNTALHYGGGVVAGHGSLSATNFISNSAGAGGGMYVASPNPGDSTHVVGVRFEGNRAAIGGGLASLSLLLQVTDTRFIRNSADIEGGGLAFGEGQARLVNDLFVGNTAAFDGAAVALPEIGQMAIVNTTINDPLSNPRAAVLNMASTLHLTNTLIVNHAIGISNTGGLVTEDYNLFYGNLTNTVGVTMGAHSLVGDPRFVDPAHDDYHLAFGSAAIDHGVDAGIYTDLDGHARPIGPGFDIGAYEYQLVSYFYLPLIRK